MGYSRDGVDYLLCVGYARAAGAHACGAVVYSALVSDGRLHRSLARAFFSYHDRLATRRRRAVNAVKGTFTFVCFNILDFVLTNL